MLSEVYNDDDDDDDDDVELIHVVLNCKPFKIYPTQIKRLTKNYENALSIS